MPVLLTTAAVMAAKVSAVATTAKVATAGAVVAAPKVIATNLAAATGAHTSGTLAGKASATSADWAALAGHGSISSGATVHVNPLSGDVLHPWLQHFLNGTGGTVIHHG